MSSSDSDGKTEVPLLFVGAGSNPKRKQSSEILEDAKMATRSERRAKWVTLLKNNALLIMTVLGVAAGLGVGFGVNPLKPSEDVKMWIGIPGEMYMRMLKMTILPLIISSVITGTSSLEPRSNGRISLIALMYILINNAAGVMLGLAVYYTLNPGNYVMGKESLNEKKTFLKTQDIIADLIRNLFPENIITACFEKTQTTYHVKTTVAMVNGTNVTVTEYVRDVATASGINVIGLTILSTIVGMATAGVGEVGQTFSRFFLGASEIIIRIMRWIIWFTPVGVASLVAASVASVEDIGVMFKSVGMFFVAVAISIAILNIIILPMCYFVFIRRNPVRFLFTALRPMMAAFAPPSSALAMPEMMNTCRTQHNVDKRVSAFVIPFGAALNRIGSCTFIVIAALLLCDLEDITLSSGTIAIVSILTWISSLALPSVPSGSIVAILIILSSVNVYTTKVGLLMALEWISDRLRTTSNALSITFSAILIDHLCQDVLKSQDENRRNRDSSRFSADLEIDVTIQDSKETKA